jgi:hypothetical protein
MLPDFSSTTIDIPRHSLLRLLFAGASGAVVDGLSFQKNIKNWYVALAVANVGGESRFERQWMVEGEIIETARSGG